MKRLLMVVLMISSMGVITAQISTGGSVDVNFGSDMKPQGTGSWNLEYRFLSIASAGIKLAGQTDFEHKFAVTPTIFARLYPFSGAFAEANLGCASTNAPEPLCPEFSAPKEA